MPMPVRSEAMATWMRRLRLRHLEALVAIAETGSLTAAARTLHTSQPSVSQWLADVEAAVGVSLYERGRRMKPTAYLAPVLHHARRVIDESLRLQAELAAIGQGSSGIVRLGAMQVAGPSLMPRALMLLKTASPETRIALSEDIAAGLWPRFERDELDVLVTRLDERAYRVDCRCEPLFDDVHCVVAGPAHPLAGRRRIAWKQAIDFPWILPPERSALRLAIDASFLAEGVAPPRPWLESVAMTTNQLLLKRTRCLVVVSRSLAEHLRRARAVVIVPLRLTSDLGPVGMVWRDRHPSPAVLAALGALRQAAATR